MMRILSKFLIVVSIVYGLMASTAIAAEEHPAQKLVIETSNKMLIKLEKEESVVKAEPERLFDLVQEDVLPHFDFDYMSSFVLGKHWRKAKPEQRERFKREFQRLLVRTYSNALLEAIGKKIDYLPLKSKKEDATEVTVRTEVEQKGGFPIPIDYRMHLKDGHWQVFDVVIDNLSLVSNYRTSFSKEINEGNIDKLIDNIANQNSKRTTES